MQTTTESGGIAKRTGRAGTVLALGALALLGALGGCGTPSVGVGYGIPGTPVSVGASVPLGKGGAPKAKGVVYRPVKIESTPTGAEIYINDQLVGSTPADVQVPFEKGMFGGAKGSAMILVKKPGHLPEGLRVFPSYNKGVARVDDGAGVGTFNFNLRKQ